MNNAEALVYFLEEEAVTGVLPGWPADMQIAVCLRPEGACDLAVHHRSEVALVLDRFATLYGWQRHELCVTPQVEGYRTRKVLFSEAQQLLALIADRPDLPEMANDYAINFRFARDEGLAPDPMTGVIEASRSSMSRSKRVGAWSASENVELDASANLSELFPDNQYFADPPAVPDCHQSLWLHARLQPDDGTLQLIIGPQEGTTTAPFDPDAGVETRPDGDHLVIPHSQLGDWSPAETATFVLPPELLSEKPAFRGIQHPHHCQVQMTAQAVVVSLGTSAQTEPDEAKLGTLTPAARTRKRLVEPIHATLAMLVGLMLVSGHFAIALDSGSQHAGAADIPDSGTAAALDVIAAMAQAEK